MIHHTAPDYFLMYPLAHVEWRERKLTQHITAVSTFRHVGKHSTMLERIGEIAETFQPFEVTFGPQEIFGDTTQGEEETLAQPVVDGREELIRLHKALLSGLVEVGCTLKNPTWSGDSYNPHCVTSEIIPEGESVGIWTIMVMSKFPKDKDSDSPSKKQIIEAFRLGKKLG